MDAKEIAEVMMSWPNGSAEDEDKFFDLVAKHFPHEDSAEIHRAVFVGNGPGRGDAWGDRSLAVLLNLVAHNGLHSLTVFAG